MQKSNFSGLPEESNYYTQYKAIEEIVLNESDIQKLGMAYAVIEDVSERQEEHHETLDKFADREYLSLLKDFSQPGITYKKNSWLRCGLVSAQKFFWYEDKNPVNPATGYLGGFFLGGVVVGLIAGPAGVISGIGTGAFSGSSVGCLFSIIPPVKLKEENYIYKNRTPKEVIETAHRLHYVAQQKYEELTVRPEEEPGSDALPSAHKTRLQKEIKRVISYTGRILDAVDISIPIYYSGGNLIINHETRAENEIAGKIETTTEPALQTTYDISRDMEDPEI